MHISGFRGCIVNVLLNTQMHNIKLYILALALFMLNVSCNVEKRYHRSGFSIEWNRLSSGKQSTITNKLATQKINSNHIDSITPNTSHTLNINSLKTSKALNQISINKPVFSNKKLNIINDDTTKTNQAKAAIQSPVKKQPKQLDGFAVLTCFGVLLAVEFLINRDYPLVGAISTFIMLAFTSLLAGISTARVDKRPQKHTGGGLVGCSIFFIIMIILFIFANAARYFAI